MKVHYDPDTDALALNWSNADKAPFLKIRV